MLTAADEWHVHQTPEPVAVCGTDRNFYDRSYFGAFRAAAGGDGHRGVRDVPAPRRRRRAPVGGAGRRAARAA